MALENEGGAGGEAGAGGASAAELFGGAAAAGGEGGAGDGEGGGAGADAGGGAIEGGPDPDFYAQLSAEVADGESASLRDWVKSKGFKDLNGMVRAHYHAEKAIHDRGVVKVPGENAKPEEIAAYHKSIGVPDDAKGYELTAVKDANGNDVPLNTALLDRLAGVAHKAGVPKAAYEALVNDFVQSQMEEIALGDTAQQTEAAAKLKEWGAQGSANMAAIDNAMQALGLTREEGLSMRAALGAGRTMDLLCKLGQGIAEDTMLTGGGSGRFGITGEAAQAQIDTMMKDPAIAAKIMLPGSAERIRYDNLQTIIGNEANRRMAAGMAG